MKKLKAGYAVEAILNSGKNSGSTSDSAYLLQLLCEFEYSVNQTTKIFQNQISPVYSIAQNMIQRGSPSPASMYLEQKLSQLFGFASPQNPESNKIKYLLNEAGLKLEEQFIQALHTVDPRNIPFDFSNSFDIKLNETSGGFLENFIFSYVPAYLGKHMYQFFSYSVDFLSLLRPNIRLQHEFMSKLTPATREAALLPVGFVLRLPSAPNGTKGFVIEIEENIPNNQTQKKIDALRDSCLKANGWITHRFPVYQFNKIKELMEPLRQATSTGFYNVVKKNFTEPLYLTEEGLHALEYSLAPMQAARIQLAVLELIRSGKLNLEADLWKLAFIERDVPAAWLAIEDFKQLMAALFRLEGKRNRLPEITVTSFGTAEFKNAKLNIEYGNKRKDIQQFKNPDQYNAIIDTAILSQTEIRGFTFPETQTPYVHLRNALHLYTDNSVLVDNSAKFREFTEKRKEKRGEYLLHLDAYDYFLQNIFRIKKLTDIQYQILEPMLQNRNSLVSVAAGTGKSTSSHLSGFFQPGLTLLIEPDAYAAYEHRKRFDEIHIDSYHIITEFETSGKNWEETADILLQHTPQFCVLSAEVLRDKAFSELLLSSDFYKKIRQIIIDEAHTVSEWSSNYKPWLSGIRSFFENSPAEWGVSLLALTELQPDMVVADICQEFNIDRADCVEIGIPLANRFKFKFIETEYTLQTDPQQDEFLYNNRKQISLLKHTDQIIKRGDKFKILLTTPFIFSPTGTFDTTGDSIGNKLKLKSSGLKTGIFQKNLTDASWKNSQNFEQNEKAVSEFESGKLDTLVANYEVTFASSFDDVTDIIQLVMPQSLDALAQLLNTTSPGTQANVTLIGNLDSGIETAYAKRMLYRNIKNKNHLQNILNELLHETHSPEISWKQKLEYALSVFADFEVQVRTKSKEVFLLEVYNNKGQILGTIDERNWAIEVADAAYLKLVKRGADLTKKWMHEDEYVNKWLNQTATVSKTNGILRVATRTATKRTLFVPATNFSVSQVQKWADDAFEKKPGLSEIWETWNQSLSAFEWMQKLKTLGKLKQAIGSNDIPEPILQHFEKIRNTSQTAYILSKLLAVRLIENFFYVPELDEFEVLLIPVSNEQIKELLSTYFSRYISEGDANRKTEATLSTQKPPSLQVAQILLDFIWDEVYAVAEEQITFTEKLYQIAREEQGKEKKNHDRITNFINDSIHFRYANRDLHPNLLADSNNLTKLSFDLVENYIKEVKGSRHLWKNLNNSAGRILQNNDSNYMIRALHGYSGVLAVPRADRRMYEAGKQLATAMNMYRRNKKTSTAEFIENLNKIAENLNFHSPQNFSNAKPIIELNLHTNWIQSFNKKFLEGYGSSADANG